MIPSEQHVARMAWQLSLAGLLPFIWCAAEVMLGTALIHTQPEWILHAYAAIILSFLGGICWAYGVSLHGNSSLSRWLLVISVAPSLAGLLALLLDARAARYAVLIIAYATWSGTEFSLREMQCMPDWFFRLRVRMSCAVISVLVLAWLLG